MKFWFCLILLNLSFFINAQDYSSLFGSEYENIDKCSRQEDTSACASVSLPGSVYQCCKYSITYYDQDGVDGPNTYCSVFVKNRISDQEIEASKKIYKESLGFIYSNMESSLTIEEIPGNVIKFECPTQTIEYDYRLTDITDEDKAVFKKDNYCLRYYYQGLMDLGILPDGVLSFGKKTITQSDCFNAVLTPSSENISTCAYASYTFKLTNGNTYPINTCLYISKSSFNTKELDKHLKEYFQGYSNINGVTIQSYNIEISNKNGEKLSYDSLTNSLKTGSSSTTGNQNGDSFLQFSKSMGLILLFTLLF